MKHLIARLLRLRIVRAYLLYSERRGGMLADSVTYRALFSIFAGVLLGFSVAALVIGGNPEAMRGLADALDTVIPGLSDVVDPTHIQARTGFSVVGIVSLAGLVAAAIGAISSLRTALRDLGDQVHDEAFIVWVYLRHLLVAIGFGALVVIAAGLSALGAFGVSTITSGLGVTFSTPLMSVVSQAVNTVVIWIVDAVAIAFIFRMLAGVRVRAGVLLRGAMLGALGLVVLQTFAGLFVRGATANPLLASFAVLIALLLWVNLSIQVVLLASSYIITAHGESHDRVREIYGAQTLAERRLKRAEDRVSTATEELRAAQASLDKGDSGVPT